MNAYELNKFPNIEFGDEIKRKVRLIVSPETTGEERISIVSVNIPPGGISEGHVHHETDEYIYFDNSGTAEIDGEEISVNKNSIIFAPRGKKHECRNTSLKQDLNLLCIFTPPFKPYGKYPDLIEKTKIFLNELD
jgi:quercetin dioxygenase-like cupin family protein